ncbi:MAG: DUF5723 family protein [Chitinophagales bacterium]
MSYRHFLFLWTLLLYAFAAYSQDVISHDVADEMNIANSLKGWNDLSLTTTAINPFTSFNDSMNHEISLSGNGVLSSNSVNLAFSVAALRNKFIDDEQKHSVSDNLTSINSFEYNTGASISYRVVSPKFLWQTPALLSLSLKVGSVQQSEFTSDLFNVVFFGNASYAGLTADFSGSRDIKYDYRQVRVGVQKKFFSHAAEWEAGVGLSFLSAKNGFEINLRNATLFTEQNGEYLDATYNFEYRQADTSNHGSLQTDGRGASLDLLLSCTLPGGKSRLVFYAGDVGFISWNKQATLYTADTSLHFEGIEVVDFLQTSDTTLFQFNKDSLLNQTSTTVKTSSYVSQFPMRLSFIYFHAFSNRWMTYAGMTYRPFTDLLPVFFIQPQYAFTSWLTGGCSIAYGGTSKFNLGLMANVVADRHWSFRLASENVLGIFIPQQTTSTSLFLQALFNF